MQCLGLPQFQYTAREMVSGLCLPGYADELFESYAVLLSEQANVHLVRWGVDLRCGDRLTSVRYCGKRPFSTEGTICPPVPQRG